MKTYFTVADLFWVAVAFGLVGFVIGLIRSTPDDTETDDTNCGF